jgi:glycerophosphoryl diester phosphodiesterase
MTGYTDPYLPIEPIFNLPCPLLFAHRGGALEVAESTSMGFCYALEETGADVLELDVQLTRDGEFVVWHGPDLDNVRIENQPDHPMGRSRRGIHEYAWKELERGWVADPEINALPVEKRDLSLVPCTEDRRLLLLRELLERFPGVPLNIEMKETFQSRIHGIDGGLKKNIESFIRILDNDSSRRTIVVASASDACMKTFRALNVRGYTTALSIREQLMLRLFDMDLSNRCVETSHAWFASRKGLVKKIHDLGGSTFVFLTAFGKFMPAIDKEEHVSEARVFRILDRGVDGIMTDRPKRVREIIEAWKKSRTDSLE